MSEIGVEDLRRILIECAGADEEHGGVADISDVPFEDLGYDSLALMEMSARLEREYGVRIDDDRIVGLRTPREVLDLVNGAADAPRS